MIKEYFKIISHKILDSKFLIKNCLTYVDKKNGLCEIKPFRLTTGQNKILTTIEENNLSIIKKDRCTGVTTLLSALSSCELITNDNLSIFFISPNKASSDIAFLRVINFLRELKKNLNLDIGISSIKNKYILLSNNNKIIFLEYDTVNDDLIGRGKNNWVIMDEDAYFKNSAMIYDKLCKVLNNVNSKFTMVSSQDGVDDLFFPIYVLGNKSCFAKNNIRWFESENCLCNKISDYNFIKSLDKKTFLENFSDKFIVNSTKDINVNHLADRLFFYDKSNSSLTLYDFIKLIYENVEFLEDKVIEYEFNN